MPLFKSCKKEKVEKKESRNSETNTKRPKQQNAATNTDSEIELDEKESMKRRSVVRSKSELCKRKCKSSADLDSDEMSGTSMGDEEEDDGKGKSKRKSQKGAVIELRINTNPSGSTIGDNLSSTKVSEQASVGTCPPPSKCPKCSSVLNEKKECTFCNACTDKAAKAIKAPKVCPHCQLQHSQSVPRAAPPPFYPATPLYQPPPAAPRAQYPQPTYPPYMAPQMGTLPKDCANLCDTEYEEMRRLEADLEDFHKARRKLITDSRIFACSSSDVKGSVSGMQLADYRTMPSRSNSGQMLGPYDEADDTRATEKEKKPCKSKKRPPAMPVCSDLNMTEAQEAKSMEAALKEFQKARRNLIDKLKGYSC